MSIRLRLTLWYAGLMALTLILSSIALYLALNQATTADTDTFLQSKARDLAVSTQIIGGPCTFYARLPDLDRFVEADVYAQVLGCGRVLDESMNMADSRNPLDSTSLSAAARGQSSFHTIRVRGVRIRVYTMPLEVRQGSPLILEVGRTFERVEDTITWLQRALLVGDVVLLALASAVGWWMSGSSLRPISRITRTVQ